MIKINKSKTADSRTCDFSSVTKDQLLKSTIQHKNDIKLGLEFIQQMITDAIDVHDFDKLSEIDSFYSDFKTGFKETSWLENHVKVNRHHLQEPEGVPDDVNLIDVIEMIVDCVMAGMARSGNVYDIKLDKAILQKAFDNTVDLLKSNVRVED